MSDYYVGSGVVSSGVSFSYGNMYVYSGGTANKITLNYGGYPNSAVMDVYSGGVANSVTINSVAFVYVESGGTANNVSVNSCAYMYIESGGKANNVTVNYSGYLFVESGGSVNRLTISSGAHLNLSSGATATNVVWTPCEGEFYGFDGGAYVTYASKYSGVYYGANNRLLSNATVMKDKVLSAYRNEMYVMSGGTAIGTTVRNNGQLYAMSGGTANSTTINWNGFMYVMSGGTVNSTTVNSSCYMYVEGGGTANRTTVNSEGYMYVYVGGTANSTTVNSGGYLDVSSGGAVNSVTLIGNGSMCVSSGGVVKNIIVRSGDLQVESDVVASNLTMSGGSLFVNYGGTVRGLTVSSAQNVEVYGSGKITGRTRFYNGATVSMGYSSWWGYNTPGIVDFDLTMMQSAGDSVLTNNLAAFQGVIDYTMKVNGKQSGTYRLAEGASGFNDTITIFNSSGNNIGTLSLNSTVTISGKTYLLKLSGGNLTVTVGDVDKTAPTVTNVKANITTSTTGSVTVTATFSDNVGVASKLYRIGSTGDWKSYSNGVTVTRNSVIYFKAVDSSGNESTVVSYSVSNITSSSGVSSITSSSSVDYGSNAKEVSAGQGFTGLVSGIRLNVFSGGTANKTVVSTGGSVYVYSRGIAESPTINKGGSLTIESGGTANKPVINNGGSTFVFSDGRAFSATVKLSGYLGVRSGGTATAVKESGGCVGSSFCAKLTYASNSFANMILFGSSATVHSGTTANSVTLVSSGCLDVFSGGSANRTVLSSGGTVYVSQGGTATNIVWTPCIGSYSLDHSAYATLASKYTGIYYGISDQLIASVTSLSSKTVSSGSRMHVFNGGKLSSMTISGDVTIHSGGSAVSTTISSGGSVCVRGDTESGLVDNDIGVWGAAVGNAVASIVNVKSSGYLYVGVGGSATKVYVSSGGRLYLAVAPKTSAQGFFVSNGVSSAFKNENGQISGYTVNSICGLDVHSGGKASNLTVESAGYIQIHRGGSASNVVMSSGARLYLDVAPGTYFKGTYYGSSVEMKNGVLSRFFFSNYGDITVSSGGTANKITLCNYSYLYVSRGGSAVNTVVSSGCRHIISSGGVTINPVVESGNGWSWWGVLVVSNGGKITGKMTFHDVISADCEAIFDFDLRKTSAGAASLVNDLSRVVGLPIYTLTVNGNQTNGTYKLADGASEFKKTISIRDASGSTLGSVGVGKSVTISGKTYKLALSEGTLTVAVGGTWTGSSSTASSSTGGSSTGSGSKTSSSTAATGTRTVSAGQTSTGLAVSSGGRVNVLSGGATNSATLSGGSMHVSNGGIIRNTKGSGIVYISSGGVASNLTISGGGLYVLNGGSVRGLTVSSLQKLYVSSGGKISARTRFYNGATVSMGSGGIVDFDLTIMTSAGDSVLTNNLAAFKGAPVYTIKVNGKQSGTYRLAENASGFNKTISVFNSSGKNIGTLTLNSTVTISGKTYLVKLSGSNLTVTVGDVAPADKTAPTVTNVKANITAATTGSVTVTATFSDNVAVSSKLYRIGTDGAWKSYSSGVTVTKNSTVYFKAVDTSGNESTVISYKVSNIVTGSLLLSNATRNISAGQTSTGIVVTTGGELNVLSGGTANKTMVDAGEDDYYDYYYGGNRGILNVSRGGVANSTTLLGGGMYVESGGVVNSTTVSDGGMYIEKGGTANSTTLINDGYLEVSSGGVASVVTVKSGGGLDVESGGTATNVSWTPCVGWVNWEDGAKVTFASSLSGVYLGYGNKLVSHAATMSSKTLVEHEDESDDYDDESYYGEQMYVMSGGKVNNITLKDESDLDVYSGGTATDINVQDASLLIVHNGGVAKNIKCDGEVEVNSGGVVSNLTLSAFCGLDVDKGGVVKGLTVSGIPESYYSYSMYNVRSGGKITGRTRFYSGAVIETYSGAIIDFDLTMMKSAGDSVLTNNLSAFREAVEWDEYGNSTSKGGIVYTLTVNGSQSGTYKLAEGASGFNKTISVMNTSGSKRGTLTVGKSVTIDGKTYQLKLSGSNLTVTVGGTSTSTSTSTSSSGSKTSSSTAATGTRTVSAGQTSTGLAVSSGGRVNVLSGGATNSATLSGGSMHVSNGGIIRNTKGSGLVYISSGGVASNLTLSGGGLYVLNGGTARGLTVSSLQKLYVSSGGKISARTRFYNGACVSMGSGGIVDFDLTIMTSAGDSVLTNDLAAFKGAPVYTIKVNGKQSGTYRLAENASGFNKTISVFNSSGKNIGTLTLNSTVTISGKTYLVKLSGSNLTITVGDAATSSSTSMTTITGVRGISAGQTSTGFLVASGGRINVSSGGIVSSATVGVSGSIYVSSGGAANTASVSSGGWLYVLANGSANNAAVSTGGYLIVSSGGTANSATVKTGGMAYAVDGGVITNASVGSGAWLVFYNGGKLTGRNTFAAGASIYASSGGIVDFNLMQTSPGAAALVNDLSAIQGAPQYTLTVGGAQSNGSYTLANGASGFNKTITVKNSIGLNIGTLYVGGSASMGGTNYSLTLANGVLSVTLSVASGGSPYGSNHSFANAYYLGMDTSICTAGNASISRSGEMDYYWFTLTQSATVTMATSGSSGDTVMYLYDGNQSQLAYDDDGGTGYFSQISRTLGPGTYYVMVKAYSSTSTISDYSLSASVSVIGGGTVASGTVVSSATRRISAGQSSSGLTVTSNGMIIVSSGGVVSNTAVNKNQDSGYPEPLPNYNSAAMGLHLSSGGTANDTTVSGQYAFFYISSGGVANGAIVNRDGRLDVSSGGVLNNATVNSSGWFNVFSGGKLTGQTTIANNARVSVYSGSILDFNISSLSPGAAARINNLSLLSGWSNATFTLTVSASQSNGSYTLANGASGFGRTISIRNTSGSQLGTLSVGQKTTINGISYTLNLNSGTLSVSVSRTVSNQDSLSFRSISGGNRNSVAVSGFNTGGAEWEMLATGDFNGDGGSDTLWRNSFEGDDGQTYNAYCTWRADPSAGDADWRMVFAAKPEEWNFLCSGDFDGDGADDIAMMNGEGVVGILGVNDGALNSWSILSAVNTSEWSFAGVADFNADGTDDIAWCNSETGLSGFWQLENRELTGWKNISALT